jgi:hypothetical protein
MEQIDRDVWSTILPHLALSQIVKLGMASKAVSVWLHDLSFAVTKLDLSPYSRNVRYLCSVAGGPIPLHNLVSQSFSGFAQQLTDEACEKFLARFSTWKSVTKLNVSHCTNLSSGTLLRLVLAVAETHVLPACPCIRFCFCGEILIQYFQTVLRNSKCLDWHMTC